jgi:hypothetical protein
MQSGSHSRLPMAEIVPITHEDMLPARFDQEADRSIPDRVLMWTGSDGVAELRRPLQDTERMAIQRRALELRSALAPWQSSRRDELEAEVSLMLNFPANRGLDETAAMGFVAQYLQLTRNQPHWAIVKVCRMVRLGKAGLPPAYCPTEAEFNLLIDREVTHFRRLLIQAQRILDAKVLPPPAPKLTREQIEAKLGRSLGASTPAEVKAPPPTAVSEGNHVARVLADIAARKALREELPKTAE